MRNRTGLLFALMALCILLCVGCTTESEETEEVFTDYMSEAGVEYEDTLVLDCSERYGAEVFVYDSSEVNAELLENREGTVVVERVFGKVTDAESGDGEVLNPYDADYDYINYSQCEGVHKDSLIITYLVYNPDTDFVDDIVERYDCVVY